jgi:hypothetical protein
MVMLTFFAMSVACVYVAVRRPNWFWTMIVASGVGIQLVSAALHERSTQIDIGSISARSTDPAVLGILIGTIYHVRRDRRLQGVQFLTRNPAGVIVLAFLTFMFVKVLVSILFRSDDIMSSRIASHAAGGLVAALGDLRDDLLPFLPIFYVYAARRSRNLRLLGKPVAVLVCILLIKAMIGTVLADPGFGDTEKRYMTSEESITLTIFSFMLLFLPVPRLSRQLSVMLSLGGLAVATFANHRSQWLALAAGFAILGLVVGFGPPMVRNPKRVRLSLTAVAIVTAILVPVGMQAVESEGSDSILPPFLVKRLYAFTNPARDPDSNWRQRLWQSRIESVGSDWPWGRPLGARPDTLLDGKWTSVPDHSAYVSMYEIGGVLLCTLAGLYWLRLMQIAALRLLRHPPGATVWPAAIVLTTTAASLAYGTAYLFPLLGPALAAVMIFSTDEETVPRYLESSMFAGDAHVY